MESTTGFQYSTLAATVGMTNVTDTGNPSVGNVGVINATISTAFSGIGGVETQIIDFLEKYVATSLFFIGVIGNILTFAVFSMKGYRGSLTAVLYRLLAVADGLVVALYDGMHSLPQQLGSSLFARSTFSCKILSGSYLWCRAFSAWVLVVIGLERFIGVLFPHRAKIICTKRRFGWIIVGLSLLITLLYGPLFISVERRAFVISDETIYGCSVGVEGSDMYWYGGDFFNYMNLIMASLGPFAFILFFNIAIVYGIVRSHVARKRNASTTSTSSESQMNNTVAILLSISIMFIVLTLPYPFYFMMEGLYRDTTDEALYNGIILLGSIAPICDSINHSINIVLYCCCGRKFRNSLVSLLCGPFRKCRNSPLPETSGRNGTSSTALQSTSTVSTK